MKATAFAPVNVALIKYWGKKDTKLRLPANSNLSVCLKNLGTVTTVKFRPDLSKDVVVIDNKQVSERGEERVVKQLDRVRELANFKFKARVESENNFPMGGGLSSSASGMAALTVAASKAAGMDLAEELLSRLARLASGSACRSIPGGFVEWRKGVDDRSSFSKTVFNASHWDLRILVVILSQKEKQVSSTDGHMVALSSPFYRLRIKASQNNLIKIKSVIKRKDFTGLGKIMEDEALNLHAVMMTSRPHLIYWLPETVRVMRAVQGWRQKGLESYFTINTGQNVFVFCRPKDEKRLVTRLKKVKGVVEVRRDRVGKGMRII